MTAQEIKDKHGNSGFGEHTPSVYVGTYAKYNNGSLFGAWLDLTTFYSIDEFYNVCKELHKDEADPEFMFQDAENIPDGMYSESDLDWIEKIIDLYSEYNEEDVKKVLEYWDERDNTATPDNIIERCIYTGDFSDFAKYEAENILFATGTADIVSKYFDYKQYEEDLSYDYTITSNYVFSE